MQKPAALLPGLPLQPQQQRIAESGLEDAARILLYHGLGSGKTRGAISGAESAGEPYTAIVPASLRNNFRKEKEKWTDQTLPTTLTSYNAMARGTGPTETPTLIVDEAQNLRNPESQRTKAVTDLADTAKHVYLLSATPIVNRPGDLAPLMRILTQQNISPEQFESRYVGQETKWPGLINWLRGVKPVSLPTIKHRGELVDKLRGHVDFEPSRDMGIERDDEHIVTPMSSEQEQLYQGFWDALPWPLRWKLQNQFPLSRQELRNLHSFLSGPRQVGLSTYPFMKGNKDPLKAFQQSPKLQRALELIQEGMQNDPNFRGVAFSNFIDAGLVPYQAALQQAGIPAGMFHGKLSDAQRKQVVDDYNVGKLKMLLLGPSGGEGLSLKGTKTLQLLDPHWNEARAQQAIGRGIRFDSHSDLPEDQRKVRVQRFLSRLPPGIGARLWRWLIQTRPSNERNDPGADDYLERMSNRKDDLNEQFLRVLQEAGMPKQSAFPEMHQTENLNPVTKPIYNFLTRPGGWFGPKNPPPTPNRPGPAGNAVALAMPTTSTAASSSMGQGYNRVQAVNNALYGKPDSFGFSGEGLAGEVQGPGSDPRTVPTTAISPSVSTFTLPMTKQNQDGPTNVVETTSARDVKPMLPLPKPRAMVGAHSWTRELGAQKTPRMQNTSQSVSSPARAFQRLS